MRFIPKSIITDQQASLIIALSNPKAQRDYSYVHLLDQFHILKSIRKKIPAKDKGEKEEIYDLLRNVMYSKSFPIVSDSLKQI